LRRATIAAVLAGTVFLTVAFVGVASALTDSITLSVDGEARTMRTTANTVQQVLDTQHIELSEGDLVNPTPETAVTDGLVISVQFSRPFVAIINGEEISTTTTASRVDQALALLGMELPGAQVSVPSHSKVPREGLTVTATSAKFVQLVLAGAVTSTRTTAATVGDFLESRGITFDEDDRLNPEANLAITDGMRIVLQGVEVREVEETNEIPFTTRREYTTSLGLNETNVLTAGVPGSKKQTWSIVYVDSVEESRALLAETVITEPVQEVLLVGTGSGGVVPPGSAQEIAREILVAQGMGDEQFGCLVQLWQRESGWRVNAENSSSGAYGIPQALPGSKMASFGSDWRTNPETQIRWGLSYIAGRYGTPCDAWSFFQTHYYY
jgi:uncharacterized protein YabE (DUF348 family)